MLLRSMNSGARWKCARRGPPSRGGASSSGEPSGSTTRPSRLSPTGMEAVRRSWRTPSPEDTRAAPDSRRTPVLAGLRSYTMPSAPESKDTSSSEPTSSSPEISATPSPTRRTTPRRRRARPSSRVAPASASRSERGRSSPMGGLRPGPRALGVVGQSRGRGVHQTRSGDDAQSGAQPRDGAELHPGHSGERGPHQLTRLGRQGTCRLHHHVSERAGGQGLEFAARGPAQRRVQPRPRQPLQQLEHGARRQRGRFILETPSPGDPPVLQLEPQGLSLLLGLGPCLGQERRGLPRRGLPRVLAYPLALPLAGGALGLHLRPAPPPFPHTRLHLPLPLNVLRLLRLQPAADGFEEQPPQRPRQEEEVDGLEEERAQPGAHRSSLPLPRRRDWRRAG